MPLPLCVLVGDPKMGWRICRSSHVDAADKHRRKSRQVDMEGTISFFLVRSQSTDRVCGHARVCVHVCVTRDRTWMLV